MDRMDLEAWSTLLSCIYVMDRVLSHLGSELTVCVQILDKALAKPQCSGMYASLCQALDSTVPEIVEENPGRSEPKTVRFRRALLNLCQAEYEQLVMQNDKSIEADDSGSKDGQVLSACKAEHACMSMCWCGDVWQS